MAKLTDTRASQVWINHHLASWALFVVLAGAMAWLRYGAGWRAPGPAWLRDVGPWVLLGIYLWTLLQAFRDSVFSGILSLLVPPYALVYLFLIADSFYARAICGGLLVGIGEDTGLWLAGRAVTLYQSTKAWIEAGGG